MATAKKSAKTSDVSPNNPCPFLRALVSQGMLPDGTVALGEVAKTIVEVAATGDGKPKLPPVVIKAIALVANGLNPLQLGSNALQGVRMSELRDGPLDKHGAGSRILDAKAKVSRAELARLGEFASSKTAADGSAEPGLNLAEITRMMDANFDRAKRQRRSIDRKLMDGEWPILLKVMGKQGQAGRYLSVADVTALFVERRLPIRMMTQLG
jgi:hypothetical protein